MTGLEALIELYNTTPYNQGQLKLCEIIEKELKRLEAIENANPSEALECLEKINNYLDDVYDYKEIKEKIRKDINTIKQALLKAQEQEKVLEIIIKKEVDVHLLKACITCYTDSLNAYNSEIKKIYSNHKVYQNKPLSFYLLTEEEFELLKRWIEC